MCPYFIKNTYYKFYLYFVIRYVFLFLIQLRRLPEQIGKLGSLVNLKISQNMLSYLPQSLGKLYNLKYLDLSKNNLHYLPGSMRNLHLISLDVSNNDFPFVDSYSMCKIDVPSLTECAARSFLKIRFVCVIYNLNSLFQF